MTVCNMAIEAGARVGMVAVDDKTISYCKGRHIRPEAEISGIQAADSILADSSELMIMLFSISRLSSCRRHCPPSDLGHLTRDGRACYCHWCRGLRTSK